MGLFRCPKCGWTLDKNAPRTPGTEIEPGLFIHPGTSDQSKPIHVPDDGAYGFDDLMELIEAAPIKPPSRFVLRTPMPLSRFIEWILRPFR